MSKVRGSLRWVLATTLAVTGYAWWGLAPDQPTASTRLVAAMPRSVPSAAAVPRRWTRPADSPGAEPGPSVDLFAATAPAKPVQVAPALPQPAPAQPRVELPRPPALVARYVGSFSDPGGELSIYLQDQQQILVARPGTALSNGYVIERIDLQPGEAGTTALIHMLYAPLGHRESIQTPALGASAT